MQNTTEHKQNIQHPYAEILRAIADGKQIQYLESSRNEWFGIPRESVLLELTRQHPRYQFRTRQEVVLINGIEVPKPCDKQLDKGQQYFYPCIEASDTCTGVKWNNDIYDERLLKRGLVHLTKEAAIKHAEALLSFTQQD